ncbi:hypothetical protein [Methylobacterium sp. Leaf117]|uniref:hypothetical protein n=1 Tax=Methylobacterium sp. Leaf117 TaxID=1736260 RepID=UPI001FCD84F0|nr:hypothetical protein [Methylobacterium sp. Leaf117]
MEQVDAGVDRVPILRMDQADQTIVARPGGLRVKAEDAEQARRPNVPVFGELPTPTAVDTLALDQIQKTTRGKFEVVDVHLNCAGKLINDTGVYIIICQSRAIEINTTRSWFAAYRRAYRDLVS